MKLTNMPYLELQKCTIRLPLNRHTFAPGQYTHIGYWLENNCKGRYDVTGSYASFTDEEDALAFKLRWGQNEEDKFQLFRNARLYSNSNEPPPI